jgi:cytoskeletal protein CcmA (bactofilin family)
MFKTSHKLIVLIMIALFVFSLAAPAGAYEVKSGDMVMIPEGKIQGPLFLAGESLVLNADVDGDVFAAGQNITINGRVNGDLLAAGRSVRINGDITGDIRCAGADIDFRGELGQSFTAFANEVRLLEGSRVNKDLLIFASSAALSGVVDRQVLGSGGTISLNGPIGSDVRFWSVENLKVGPSGSIAGKLHYGSPNQASVSPEAKITGATEWEQIESARRESPRPAGVNWVFQLVWFIAGVLVWGMFALIFPRIWAGLSQNTLQTPWSALGWGFLFLLVTPLASLLLLITVVGIPLSLSMMAAYAALLYAGKIIAGDAVGRYLARRFSWEGRIHSIFPFMIGFAGLILLGKIPVVGFLISIVAASIAIGAVFLAVGRTRSAPGE